MQAVLKQLLALTRKRAINTNAATPRLNEHQALTIARNAAQAASDSSWGDSSLLVTALEKGDRIVHVVSAPVIGASFVVEIDDETGAVLSAQTIGVR
jgi:hypothetical protein